MANEKHTDVRDWEVDSSTRQSVQPFTKYTPFRTATSTTAANIKAIARGETAANWVTNPSVEGTNIAMFGTSGAAISRSSAQASLGANSLLVNPDNGAAGEGMYWASPMIPFNVNPQFITAQCEVRGASASGAVKIEIRDITGTTILATSADSNLAASWNAINTSYAIPGSTAAAAYRVYVTTTTQINIDFYLDKIMFEVRTDNNTVSTYIDGTIDNLHAWTGEAHASTSIKRPDMEIIRGLKLTNESATAAEIVYVAFDTTATATTGIPILAGATLETPFPIHFGTNISVVAATGTPTVSGVVWGVGA